MKLSFRYESDEGHVLEFTEADIGGLLLGTPYDVDDVTPVGSQYRLSKLTIPHVKLDVTFPLDSPPRWRNPGDFDGETLGGSGA